jgi:NADH:ubiquinone oxidoreductase subunit 6 (subunit J)
MIQAFAFYLFATLVIVSGAVTILARNPVHSVLWLILAFFNAAGLMILVGPSSSRCCWSSSMSARSRCCSCSSS